MSYADVAGIDAVKGDIQVAMDMLLGDPTFQAIGAKPYRVRPTWMLSQAIHLRLSRPVTGLPIAYVSYSL